MYIGSVSMRLNLFQILSVAVLLGCSACSELPFVPQHTAPTQIFLADYSTAWTAAMEAIGTDVKSNNRDLGTIETNWIENTERLHFLNVFSDEDFFPPRPLSPASASAPGPKK